MTMKISSNELHRIRLTRFLSLRALAEQSGVNHVTIHRLEQGKQLAMLSTIRKLAVALRVDPSELVES